MAQLVTSRADLPPDMILLPGGREMPLGEFWREHGDDLRPYLDAQIAVATPSLHVPDSTERAISAMVGLVIGGVVGFLTRGSKAGSWIGTIATAYVGHDVTDWIVHHIDHGRTVRVYRIRELFPGAAPHRAG